MNNQHTLHNNYAIKNSEDARKPLCELYFYRQNRLVI